MVGRDEPPRKGGAKGVPADPNAKRDRASILARRRFFIASALAGITAASCNNKEPQVCLKVQAQPEADAGAPQPCLDLLTEADKDGAAAPLVTAAPSETAPTPTADPPPPTPPKPEPRVCLRVASPPRTEQSSKVCLLVARPPEDEPKP